MSDSSERLDEDDGPIPFMKLLGEINPDPIPPKLTELVNNTLNAKAAELINSGDSLKQIAEYCRTFYSTPDLPHDRFQQLANQSRTYAFQSLAALAYQMDQYAEAFHDSFNQQMTLLEEKGNDLSLVSLRLSAAYYEVGINAVKQKPMSVKSKLIKTETLEQTSYPLNLAAIGGIDLNELDEIGVSLVNFVPIVPKPQPNQGSMTAINASRQMPTNSYPSPGRPSFEPSSDTSPSAPKPMPFIPSLMGALDVEESFDEGPAPIKLEDILKELANASNTGGDQQESPVQNIFERTESNTTSTTKPFSTGNPPESPQSIISPTAPMPTSQPSHSVVSGGSPIAANTYMSSPTLPSPAPQNMKPAAQPPFGSPVTASSPAPIQQPAQLNIRPPPVPLSSFPVPNNNASSASITSASGPVPPARASMNTPISNASPSMPPPVPLKTLPKFEGDTNIVRPPAVPYQSSNQAGPLKGSLSDISKPAPIDTAEFSGIQKDLRGDALKPNNPKGLNSPHGSQKNLFRPDENYKNVPIDHQASSANVQSPGFQRNPISPASSFVNQGPTVKPSLPNSPSNPSLEQTKENSYGASPSMSNNPPKTTSASPTYYPSVRYGAQGSVGIQQPASSAAAPSNIPVAVGPVSDDRLEEVDNPLFKANPNTGEAAPPSPYGQRGTNPVKQNYASIRVPANTSLTNLHSQAPPMNRPMSSREQVASPQIDVASARSAVAQKLQQQLSQRFQPQQQQSDDAPNVDYSHQRTGGGNQDYTQNQYAQRTGGGNQDYSQNQYAQPAQTGYPGSTASVRNAHPNSQWQQDMQHSSTHSSVRGHYDYQQQMNGQPSEEFYAPMNNEYADRYSSGQSPLKNERPVSDANVEPPSPTRTINYEENSNASSVRNSVALMSGRFESLGHHQLERMSIAPISEEQKSQFGRSMSGGLSVAGYAQDAASVSSNPSQYGSVRNQVNSSASPNLSRGSPTAAYNSASYRPTQDRFENVGTQEGRNVQGNQRASPAMQKTQPVVGKLNLNSTTASSIPSVRGTPHWQQHVQQVQQSKPAPVVVSAPKQSQYVGRVRVLYAYQAEADEEISTVPGEILEVINWDVGSGWMEGESIKRKMQGIFPASYVEAVDE